MDEYSFPRAKVRRRTVTFGSRQHGKFLGARELKFSIINIFQGIEAIIVPTINYQHGRGRSLFSLSMIWRLI
jgi:hypothetical protein